VSPPRPQPHCGKSSSQHGIGSGTTSPRNKTFSEASGDPRDGQFVRSGSPAAFQVHPCRRRSGGRHPCLLRQALSLPSESA
jgi:hypothetical protein